GTVPIRGNLSAREAHRAGLLDILASDYHPSALLPAVRGTGQGRSAGPCRVDLLATLNPARALGLTDRGALAPGLLADLVIADDTGIGHVRATLRAGLKIYSDGSVVAAIAA
ncbi:MAG: amidohydrolase family protein, partial [Tabrizicola sp.]|nr:amidohydrolase family protein [Tabrizicola sp.]